MPNWCNCTLNLKGNEGEVEKFFADVNEKHKNATTEFSFNTYVPIPLDTGNCYQWCMDHWGVKWDAEDPTVYTDFICFNTAWGPPNQFVLTLSEQYPGIEFMLEYEGDDSYDGEFICEDGEVKKNEWRERQERGIFSEGHVINPGMDVRIFNYEGVHCFIGALPEYMGEEECEEEPENQMCEVALRCEEIVTIPAGDVSKYISY